MTGSVEELTQEVSTRLSGLEAPQNAAFSAACAERLMPLYLDFCVEQSWDDKQQLRGVLDDVWSALLDASQVARLDRAIHRLEQLVPHADDFNSALITAAQDCVICTDIAVRWLLGRPTEFSVSPGYAVEGIASAESARRTGYLSFGPAPDADEDQILGLPAVQNELAYQRQDVETLSTTARVADVTDEIRRRAHRNGHK
jgi:uncharacterized protein YjaG (DUF416 family)